MRRILLSCAILVVLTLPAATASAGADTTPSAGFVVLRNAANRPLSGSPFLILVVHGFVLGSVKPRNEARVDIVQLPSQGNQGAPVAAGPDRTQTIRWHGFTGQRFSGSGFRFRAMGGYYRVVVRGSGVYLYAGGHGRIVSLRGSSFDRGADGSYSIDDSRFRSLPTRPLTRTIGRG
ncbi:MAG TPA: hypothetical protein VJP41_08375 [Gaiellaceae bacterium]|nr:hypothetical protein [Gaiellaceae bacterium]